MKTKRNRISPPIPGIAPPRPSDQHDPNGPHACRFTAPTSDGLICEVCGDSPPPVRELDARYTLRSIVELLATIRKGYENAHATNVPKTEAYFYGVGALASLDKAISQIRFLARARQ